MNHWKSRLKDDPTHWLLEEENPSVRYFALKQLLDKPDSDPLVEEARQQIMQTGLVPEILSKQKEPEYLKSYPRFYTNKYKGLVWSLMVLAELGATAVPPIQAQCEYLLNHSQETRDGGFSQNTAVKTGGGRIKEVVPCLTGNMVWCLIHFGYLEDPRVQRGIRWLTQHLRFHDGVEKNPPISPYNRAEVCWGAHSCHMGIVKALKAFSVIPEETRSQPVRETIDLAVEFLLIHHIHKRSHNLKRLSKPGWKKFGFPLMYQTDVLEILGVLSSLEVRDNRMNEALDLVLSKQDSNGRWPLENTYGSDRLLIPMGQKDEPSKWLTLKAMHVLKAQYENGVNP